VEQGIDAALKAFDTVEPKLQAFYAASRRRASTAT
jgi:hypothetical protein